MEQCYVAMLGVIPDRFKVTDFATRFSLNRLAVHS
jgi:hypothetical protein